MRSALLDLDGTLCGGASTVPLLKALSDVPGVRQDYLAAALRAASRDESTAVSPLRGGVYANYPQAVAGMRPEEVQEAARRAWPDMTTMIFPFAHVLTGALRSWGFEVVLVTGCIREMADLVADALGIQVCMAATLAVVDGRYTDDFVMAPARKGAKTALVKDLVASYGVDLSRSMAMGNGARDAEMLDLVRFPMAFEPEPDLIPLVESCGWPRTDRYRVLEDLRFLGDV